MGMQMMKVVEKWEKVKIQNYIRGENIGSLMVERLKGHSYDLWFGEAASLEASLLELFGSLEPSALRGQPLLVNVHSVCIIRAIKKYDGDASGSASSAA